MRNDGKCVGKAIGWTGGNPVYCNEPVKIGNRFCYRCQLVAINTTIQRIEALKRQLEFAEQDLQILLHTTRETER